MNDTLLRVSNLSTSFATDAGLVHAVGGVSFRVRRGEMFALVGESGCGKSVTALSIMRLVACPPGRIGSGSVNLDGKNLLALSERQMQDVRGSQISMIFQEPMTSLNPVFTCGFQIVEAIRLHREFGPAEARKHALAMLETVGIPEPAQRFHEYPHQLSGGMQQRVMIAMALSCNPKLLIADEPTTALDVTIQAQILGLLSDLQKKQDLSILLITHDLGVVAEASDTVGVMYASRLVELTDVHRLFAKPLHPYTHGLFASLPRMHLKRDRLPTIPGAVPSPLHFPSGCTFHPRCSLTKELATAADESATVVVHESAGESFRVLKRCATLRPELREIEPKHWCACFEVPGYEPASATDPSAEQ